MSGIGRNFFNSQALFCHPSLTKLLPRACDDGTSNCRCRVSVCWFLVLSTPHALSLQDCWGRGLTHFPLKATKQGLDDIICQVAAHKQIFFLKWVYILFFSHQTQAYPTLTLFSVPGLSRVLGTWMVWSVLSQCYTVHLTWLVRSVITQLEWQYTQMLKEDLDSFLPPHKKCKQLVKLDWSNLLQFASACKEKPPKPPFNPQKE